MFISKCKPFKIGLTRTLIIALINLMNLVNLYESLHYHGRFYLSAFLLLVFIVYIINHMFYSESSIAGRRNLEARALHLQEKATTLKQRRLYIEREATLLRPNSLDRELLEEKARDIIAKN